MPTARVKPEKEDCRVKTRRPSIHYDLPTNGRSMVAPDIQGPPIRLLILNGANRVLVNIGAAGVIAETAPAKGEAESVAAIDLSI